MPSWMIVSAALSWSRAIKTEVVRGTLQYWISDYRFSNRIIPDARGHRRPGRGAKNIALGLSPGPNRLPSKRILPAPDIG